MYRRGNRKAGSRRMYKRQKVKASEYKRLIDGKVISLTSTLTCILFFLQPSKCYDLSLNPLVSEPTEQSCNLTPCPVYTWIISSSWSDCNVACGGGEQYALIQCFNTALISRSNPNPHGVAVADQFCVASARPLGTRSCSTQPCPDYHYRTGVWSGCSANCNGGTMTREVACHNMQGIPMSECTLTTCPDVDDIYCQTKGLSKPPSVSTCNQQSCVNSMWWARDWGDCSKSCGGGIQTRVVDCVDIGTYAPVDEYECGGSRPSTKQYCNTHKCAEYQWVPSAWSECSAECDGGTRTRSDTNRDVTRWSGRSLGLNAHAVTLYLCVMFSDRTHASTVVRE